MRKLGITFIILSLMAWLAFMGIRTINEAYKSEVEKQRVLDEYKLLLDDKKRLLEQQNKILEQMIDLKTGKLKSA